MAQNNNGRQSAAGVRRIRGWLPLGRAAGRMMPAPDCVIIPEGWFQMGCERGRDEEKPVHRVWVDAFRMAIHQVRNRDYGCFLEATGSLAPPDWLNPDLN